MKASAEAAKKGVQHFLIIVKSDGSFSTCGSDNSLKAVVNNQHVYNELKDIISANLQDEDSVVPVNLLTYPYLPCSPFSNSWKGSGMIRRVLDSMVTSAGYGKYGKTLGQGSPPLGWPEDISWTSYAGASRSGLSNLQLTHIIVSMLTAAGIDPEHHVKTHTEYQEGYVNNIAHDVTSATEVSELTLV